MATASGKGLQRVQLTAEQIPVDVFVRCPKHPRWDFVQVRAECVPCEHCVGVVEDASAPEPLYGSHCAYPIARWWKRITVHADLARAEEQEALAADRLRRAVNHDDALSSNPHYGISPTDPDLEGRN